MTRERWTFDFYEEPSGWVCHVVEMPLVEIRGHSKEFVLTVAFMTVEKLRKTGFNKNGAE